jgi:hypothetical protein
MEIICHGLATIPLRNLLEGFEQNHGPSHSGQPVFRQRLKPWSYRMRVKSLPQHESACLQKLRAIHVGS